MLIKLKLWHILLPTIKVLRTFNPEGLSCAGRLNSPELIAIVSVAQSSRCATLSEAQTPLTVYTESDLMQMRAGFGFCTVSFPERSLERTADNGFDLFIQNGFPICESNVR